MQVTITDPTTSTDYRLLLDQLATELRYCMDLLAEKDWGDLEDRCWYRDGTAVLEQYAAATEGAELEAQS